MTKDIKGWEEKEWEEKLPGGLYKPHGVRRSKVKCEVCGEVSGVGSCRA